MTSTFLGLEIGKRGIVGHQKGLEVIGHNLSNADNEDYSRQRVIMKSVDPLYRPDLTRAERPGQIGQGMEVAEIRRERDIHLDKRIYTETGKKEYWNTQNQYLGDIETIYDALGNNNLQQRSDDFWRSWQELASNPSEGAVREDLVEKSLVVTGDIRDKASKLHSLRQELNHKIIQDVREVNQLATKIAALNKSIQGSLNLGDRPNDLLDRRDAAIEKLSSYADVSVNFKDPDEMMVYFRGREIVQGDKYDQLVLDTDPTNSGLSKVTWRSTNDVFDFNGHQAGSLVSLIQARDDLIPEQINNLDTIATNIIYGVNDLHQKGFDKYNQLGEQFFTVHPSTIEGNGDADVDANGILESNLIYQVTGGAALNQDSVIGSFGTITLENGQGEEISIDYQANETIKSVISRINLSQSSVNAFLNPEGQLTFKSKSSSDLYPFSLERLNDSGDFLSGIAEVLQTRSTDYKNSELSSSDSFHPESSFVRTPIKNVSSWIAVAPKIIANPDLIAARGGTDYDSVKGQDVALGRYDNNIAQEISSLRHNKTLFDNQDGFSEFYVNTVGEVGSKRAHAESEADKYSTVHESLKNFRQAYSGVNIDEELSQMVALQNGYQAGAKIIKVMDEMVQTIIGLVS